MSERWACVEKSLRKACLEEYWRCLESCIPGDTFCEIICFHEYCDPHEHERLVEECLERRGL